VAAEVLDQYPDGVWLADLAAVADPDAVATQVSQIFVIKQGPGMTATDAVAAYLADKRALLILDNCEHVLDAAAALADRLVSLSSPCACWPPADRRSTFPVRSPGGSPPSLCLAIAIGPTVVDIAGLASCEAVHPLRRPGRRRPAQLRLHRGQVLGGGRHLPPRGRHPSGIELAAARVRVFTPAEIAAGLDPRFGHRRAPHRPATPADPGSPSLDWSHDLLTEVEQVVCRRLSVFAGDFEFDATVAVCPPIAAHQVLDLLSLLVDKSLVQVDNTGR
jgi:predicted ATPase